MSLLELERHPNGPRLRVCGQRVHHGAIGLALSASRQPALRLLGLLLELDDYHDRAVWFVRGPQRDPLAEGLVK